MRTTGAGVYEFKRIINTTPIRSSLVEFLASNSINNVLLNHVRCTEWITRRSRVWRSSWTLAASFTCKLNLTCDV